MAIKTRSKKFRKLEIDLSGPDGNAFCLMATASRWAKQLNLNEGEILEEMRGGNYENLIKVFDKYFGKICDLIR